MAAFNEALLHDATPKRHGVDSDSPLSVAASTSAASISACSITQTGSDARSCFSPTTPRSNPLQPKTPDFALSDHDTSEVIEVMISPAPVSSLDGPSLGARRSLVKQLVETEVFDMSCDSDDDNQLVTKMLADAPSGKAMLPAGSLEFHRKVSRECTGTTMSPSSTEDGGTPSIRHLEYDDAEQQGDAWMEDDWVSPVRARAQTSPCVSARALDRKQCQVADAVLLDLQVDMQSQVQRAVNQMSSWISEEITFARQAVEEDMHKTCESWAAKHEDMQKSHDQLSARVEEFRNTLDEQVHTIQNLEQSSGSRTRLRASTEPQLGPQPSASVLEARTVAEDRKWRLQLDGLQKGIDKSLERIEVLEKQSAHLTEKGFTYDADIAKFAGSMSTVNGLQSQLSSARLALEADMGQCFQKVEKLSKETDDVTSCLVVQTAEVKDCVALIQSMQDKLGMDAHELAAKASAYETSIKENTAQLLNLESQFVNESRKVATAIDAQDSSIKGCIGQIRDLGDKLDDEAQLLSERGLVCEASMKETVVHVRGLEQMFNNANLAFAQRAETKADESATQLQDLKERQWKSTEDLVAKANAFDSRVESFVSRICDLEGRLGNEAMALNEKVAAHDARFEDNVAHVRNLEKKLDNEAATFSKNVAAQVQTVEAECNRIKHDVQRDAGALEGIRVQLSHHENTMTSNTSSLQKLEMQVSQQKHNIQQNTDTVHSTKAHLNSGLQKIEVQVSQHACDLQRNTEAIQATKAHLSVAQKERLAELEVVCGKLQEHNAQLVSLPKSIRAEFSSTEQGLVRAMADLATDLRQAHVELSKTVSSKASHSDLQQACVAMQTWVDEAQNAHQAAVTELAGSLKRTSVTCSEQEAILEKHGDWMTDVSAFLHQAQERQQGLSHILYRIVEEDYSELTSLFQDAVAA